MWDFAELRPLTRGKYITRQATEEQRGEFSFDSSPTSCCAGGSVFELLVLQKFVVTALNYFLIFVLTNLKLLSLNSYKIIQQ